MDEEDFGVLHDEEAPHLSDDPLAQLGAIERNDDLLKNAPHRSPLPQAGQRSNPIRREISRGPGQCGSAPGKPTTPSWWHSSQLRACKLRSCGSMGATGGG